MVDITHKSNTLRMATAQAIVTVGDIATIKAIESKQVPKGDIFEAARIAALFGVKKTAELIPDCHPLPIEFTGVSFKIDDLKIYITITVKTIYKTGVEVEAMHGASIAALTMYDMLKPIDKNVSINDIKLVKKTGGKSSYKTNNNANYKIAVLVISDSISAGNKEDKAGIAISDTLSAKGFILSDTKIVADNIDAIRLQVNKWSDETYDLILTTGGTGLSPKDLTPEAIQPLLTKEVPGIMEAARKFGQDRMPYAMLSRGVAGFIKNTLIVTLPGSTKGAQESMQAIFPHIMHIFDVRKVDFRHEK